MIWKVNEFFLGGLINHRTLFLTVPEVRSLKLGCQHGRVLVRPSSGLQTADCSLHPHVVEAQGSSRGPFYESWSHSWGLCLYDPISSQRPHLLIPSHWRLGSQWLILGRQTFSLYHVSRAPSPYTNTLEIRPQYIYFERIHSVHNTHINKAQETIRQTFLLTSQLFPSFIRNMSENASAFSLLPHFILLSPLS